jgi:hypothetical protein
MLVTDTDNLFDFPSSERRKRVVHDRPTKGTKLDKSQH